MTGQAGAMARANPDIKDLISVAKRDPEGIPAAIRGEFELIANRYREQLREHGLGPSVAARLAWSLTIIDAMSSRRVLESAFKIAETGDEHEPFAVQVADQELYDWVSGRPSGRLFLNNTMQSKKLEAALKKLNDELATADTSSAEWREKQEQAERDGEPSIMAKISTAGTRMGEMDSEIIFASERMKTMVTMWYEKRYHLSLSVPSLQYLFASTRFPPHYDPAVELDVADPER